MALTLKREYVESTEHTERVVPVGTVRYAWRVLGTETRTERISSDDWHSVTYAKVWTGDRVELVSVASDAFGRTYDVDVDAPADVVEKAARWTAARDAEAERERLRLAHERAVDRAVARAKRVEREREVEVVRGRKVKVGSRGVAFWVGETRYGTRVGIELTTGERVFTALSNVEVLNPDEYLELPDAA